MLGHSGQTQHIQPGFLYHSTLKCEKLANLFAYTGDFGYFFVRVIAAKGSHFDISFSQRNMYSNLKVA